LRTITPYAKQAQIRLSGLDGNNNVAFVSYSDTFTIAPYFSLAMQTGSQLALERRVGMNFTNEYSYIEG
jgi:hypothetical protein